MSAAVTNRDRKIKHRIIIRARSVKSTPPDTAYDFPTNDKSFFTDRYDYLGEQQRLGELADESYALLPEEAEYEALEVYKYHRGLLRKHIHSNYLNSRQKSRIRPEYIRLDDYEIYLSEDDSFGAVGRLTDDSDDYIALQTKEAVRLWIGNNDKTNPQRRWCGIRYAIPLSIELFNEARRDNPFAYSALLTTERELQTTVDYLRDKTEMLKKQLEETTLSGIHIGVRVNREPTNIPVKVSNLGFNLLELLTVYDEFVRYSYTFINKKINLGSNDSESVSAFEMKQQAGTFCRVFTQNLYNRTMAMRTLKKSKCLRSDFLNDADGETGRILQNAVAAKLVEPLTEDILAYKAKLKSGHLKSPYTAETMQQITAYARQYGLLAENSVSGADNDETSEGV